MRALLVIVIVIALMFLGGWLVINVGSHSSTVELRTDKMEEDTAEAVENTKDVLERAGDRIEQTGDRIKQSTDL